MNLILSILIFLQPFFYNTLEKSEYIDWQKNRPLTWDDFKAPVNKNSSAAATTATQITAEFSSKNNMVSFKISCKFSKNESWSASKTDYILMHEQGHFDIAEIYTRKLYKALSNHIQTFPGNIKDLNIIYQNIMEQKDSYQQLYDLETKNSIDKIKQKDWLINIEKILNDLEEYAVYHQNKPKICESIF